MKKLTFHGILGLAKLGLRNYWFLIVWISLCSFLFRCDYLHYKKSPHYYYLRRILGLGVCISRGTAAVLNVAVLVLVIPMGRSLQSIVRNCLPQKINLLWISVMPPAKTLHLIVAVTILLTSVAHSVSHVVNTFNFSRNFVSSFPEVNMASHRGESALRLIFTTVPGITGVLMVMLLVILSVTSLKCVRDRNYEIFYYTHHCSVLFLFLLLVHPLSGTLKGVVNIDSHPPGCRYKMMPAAITGNTSHNNTINKSEERVSEGISSSSEVSDTGFDVQMPASKTGMVDSYRETAYSKPSDEMSWNSQSSVKIFGDTERFSAYKDTPNEIFGNPEPPEEIFGYPEPFYKTYEYPEQSDKFYGYPEPSDEMQEYPLPSDKSYGYLEPSDEVFGYPEPSDDVYGYSEPPAETYAYPEPSNETYQYPEPSDGVFGYPEPSDKVYEYPELPVEPYGHPEPSDEAFGYPEPSDETYRYPNAYDEVFGYPEPSDEQVDYHRQSSQELYYAEKNEKISKDVNRLNKISVRRNKDVSDYIQQSLKISSFPGRMHIKKKLHKLRFRICKKPPVFVSIQSRTWLWVLMTLLYLLLDCLIKHCRGLKEVQVIRVREFQSDVLELTLRKKGFRCNPGQYVLLRSPNIAHLEWHPFTIAKCPHNNSGEFTILMRTKGNWCRKFNKEIMKFQNFTRKCRERIISNKTDFLKESHHEDQFFKAHSSVCFYHRCFQSLPPTYRCFHSLTHTSPRLFQNLSSTSQRYFHSLPTTYHKCFQSKPNVVLDLESDRSSCHVQQDETINKIPSSVLPENTRPLNKKIISEESCENNFPTSRNLLTQPTCRLHPSTNKNRRTKNQFSLRKQCNCIYICKECSSERKVNSLSNEYFQCRQFDLNKHTCLRCLQCNINDMKSTDASGSEKSNLVNSLETKNIFNYKAPRNTKISNNMVSINLHSQNSKFPVATTDFSLYLDGPFNSVHEALLSYPVIIGIAGGIGITPLLASLNYLINYKQPKNKIFTPRRIHIVWVFRDLNLVIPLAPFFNQLVNYFWDKGQEDRIEIRFHLTGSFEAESEAAADIHKRYPFLMARIYDGRPKWNELFEVWKETYRSSRMRVGVFCCGPKTLNKEIRSYSLEALAQGRNFNYHHESFS